MSDWANVERITADQAKDRYNKAKERVRLAGAAHEANPSEATLVELVESRLALGRASYYFN